MGFELGFEKKKNQFAGKWDQDPFPPPPPPSGPSVKKQRQQMIKLFCHKMNKSASTGGFSLPKEFFVKVYENK